MVEMLGGFRVTVDGEEPVREWPQRRPAELVQLLALSPGRELQREQVIEAMWPDLGPDAGGANLRKAAHLARRALGHEDAVELSAGRVALFPERRLDSDVDAYRRTAANALASEDEQACAEAAATFAELLPDRATPTGRRRTGTSSPACSCACSSAPGSGSCWFNSSRPTSTPTGS